MKKYHNKRSKKKLSEKDLKTLILKTFIKNPSQRFNAKNLLKRLSLENSKDEVNWALEKLSSEKKLKFIKEGKYKLLPKKNRDKSSRRSRSSGGEYEGYVDMTKSGSAYIVCDGLENDVHVSAGNLNTAMNGDKVRISVDTYKGRYKPDGRVIEILERNTLHFLGVIRMFRNEAIVYASSKSVGMDINVAPSHLNNAKDGEKVVVEIIDWKGSKIKTPWGKVTEVLGMAGSHDIEMKSILIENGFPLSFSDDVIQESEALEFEITEEELSKRRDLRGVTTFTIDPDTAKDFDDAISYQELENGALEIGVHIADVSHYVKPGTELDKEAYSRSTSVYLVDRVLPMLPEKISNELCSLRPEEEKFCFSTIFKFNSKYQIIDEWIGKTIIRSDRRFSYEEAQERLESGEGDFARELRKLNELAHKLRKEKFKNGAISFESDELLFKLDGEGKPIGIFVKKRQDAHMLIEDFMLLANKEVAKYIAGKSKIGEIPFVYRVHDLPDVEKLTDLGRFAKEMGISLKFDSPQQIVNSLNMLAKEARSDEALKMLEPMAIRTMSKAEYTTDNIGHYGLGFDFYTHFTSPIRRYSDVLVHRILEKNLKHDHKVNKEDLELSCRHISFKERKAMSAERESVKYKQVEYMIDKVGETFPGIVSGMIDKGFFVEIDTVKAEGLISFDQLKEVYQVEKGRLKAIGKRTGRTIKLGTRVMVKLLSVDLHARQIEMEVLEFIDDED